MKMKKYLGNQQGGSLIEFVVIAPLLFLILFGIIEFGILLYDKAMITNASREGARFGIVFDDPRRTDGEIITRVNTYCSNYLITFGSATPATTVARTGAGAGDILTVTVTYRFDFLVFSNIIAMLGGSTGNFINLNAVTVMRLE